MKKVLNEKKILSMLGMAMRARKVVSGEFATENAIKSFQACMVIVAEDASNNTKKLFRDKCSFYEVPYIEFGTKEKLGHAIGKDYRASLALVEEGFADAVSKLLEKNGGSNIDGKNKGQ